MDIRWKQRLVGNYKKALTQLQEAVDLSQERELSNLEKQGLIQTFEYTYELSWNVIKDYFVDQGYLEIRGSRDAFREAFNQGLIEDGEAWMESIKSRQNTVHGYDQDTADSVIKRIVDTYTLNFQALLKKLEDQ